MLKVWCLSCTLMILCQALPGQSWLITCICKAFMLKMAFRLFNDCKNFKNQNNNIFWHMKIIYNSNCNVYKKFWWSKTTSFIFVLSIADFMLQWQSWVVSAETTWPAKLKIFTVWTFIEKVFQPLHCIINNERRDLCTRYHKTLRPGMGCTKAWLPYGESEQNRFWKIRDDGRSRKLLNRKKKPST